MNVLNPVRRVRQSFEDFAYPHMDLRPDRLLGAGASSISTGSASIPACSRPTRTSSRAACASGVTIALATVCEPEFIIADEPTTALDVLVQQDVLGADQGRAGAHRARRSCSSPTT